MAKSFVPSRSSSAETCTDPPTTSREIIFRVRRYDLAATFTSGQAFRWEGRGKSWTGVVCGHWVKLQQRDQEIVAEAAVPQTDWGWLAHYLQVDARFDEILATFPGDPPMLAAVDACRGLRLLRQDPWECLASFILSSTKQIVQIRQIVAILCENYGDAVPVGQGTSPTFAFPTAQRLAELNESHLRDCKMGFRAPYLLHAARAVAERKCDLWALDRLDLSAARHQLLKLQGVGDKIADCVLLFAFGFSMAFPMDVWVRRALRELYFRGTQPTPANLRAFAAAHFGPYAGYAQQYLFHYIRTRTSKNVFN
jgi:N-glycosylase/DNA lyase